MQKLYQAKNKGSNVILIVASNEQDAKEIALKLNFVKSIKNVQVRDFSKEYLNSERLKQGLDFNKLPDGQFFQCIDENGSSWSTYMPNKQAHIKKVNY